VPKSTLKRFLKGKVKLDDCKPILMAVADKSSTRGWDGGFFMLWGWRCVVLDDGTAITYEYGPELERIPWLEEQLKSNPI
jgi:hypothetical protein